MKIRYMFAIGVLSSGWMPGAYAFDKGLYVGGSVGQADASITSSSNNIDFKDSATAYKILLGVRPLNWFAVEASYVDLGKGTSASYSASTTGISAFALGILDKGPVDLFAKVGAINTSSKITLNEYKADSNSSNDLAYGAGIQFSVLAFKIRGEYERFEVGKGTNMASVGIVFTFL